MTDTPQTTLLRIAAFLVDALSIAIVLILPATVTSYAMAWIGGTIKAIQLVWLIAIAVLMACMLLRDGLGGRSLGKHLLGLRLVTPRGEHCSYGRSCLRNLPLLIPLWNLIEVALVARGGPRTGDRIARTAVLEE